MSERRAYMVVDAAGEPAVLLNEVAPIRWSRGAAERLALYLDGLSFGLSPTGGSGPQSVAGTPPQNFAAGNPGRRPLRLADKQGRTIPRLGPPGGSGQPCHRRSYRVVEIAVCIRE